MAYDAAHCPARFFHLNSSNARAKAVDLAVDYDTRPRRFKSLPSVTRVALPKGNFNIQQTLGEALRSRTSTRDFKLRSLPLARLSQLLYLSHGIRGLKTVEGEVAFDRCAPSAGGLYPIELYVATQQVQGVPDGVYHYDARYHRLEEVVRGNRHAELAELTIGQDMIRTANAVVVMCAVFQRTMWKYGSRGYRYTLLDAGHIGQNLYLSAGAMGLGAVTIGGFFDAEVNRLLKLSSDEDALYLACIGQHDRPHARKAKRRPSTLHK
ncbi:hypothetical protein BWI17_18265 [Betaproteobacteria bacterium GR16-43]|nr:hypothetical protein BWI17_18265 [Betaproteobacteria bacterium GR16-43]